MEVFLGEENCIVGISRQHNYRPGKAHNNHKATFGYTDPTRRGKSLISQRAVLVAVSARQKPAHKAPCSVQPKTWHQKICISLTSGLAERVCFLMSGYTLRAEFVVVDESVFLKRFHHVMLLESFLCENDVLVGLKS